MALERRWWHRLAVVFFAVLLVTVLLYSFAIFSSFYSPPDWERSPMITHWDESGHEMLPDLDMKKSVPLDGVSFTPISPNAQVVQQKLPDPAPAQGASSSDDWEPVPATPQTPVVKTKTVDMPDGTTSSFPGYVSDDAINAQWMRNLQRRKYYELSLATSLSILFTLISSYLLQAAYKTVLYVIFGTLPKTES
jgi:hypothetical protein